MQCFRYFVSFFGGFCLIALPWFVGAVVWPGCSCEQEHGLYHCVAYVASIVVVILGIFCGVGCAMGTAADGEEKTEDGDHGD